MNGHLETGEFWLSNPNVLLDSRYIQEIFPQSNMTFERKLNAITRIVMLLTLIGIFALKQRDMILTTCVVTLGMIVLLYKMRGKVRVKGEGMESFKNLGEERKMKGGSHVNLQPAKYEVEIEENNPFHNVLVPDFGTEKVDRRKIEEKDTEKVYDAVKRNVVRLFQNDDEIEDEEVKDKLFHDLGDSFVFQNSMRNYVTNPNQGVMNNQNAFAEFCYGKMRSTKEKGIHPI